jgi:putative nucleotidyltransferase with HDIG domain
MLLGRRAQLVRVGVDTACTGRSDWEMLMSRTFTATDRVAEAIDRIQPMPVSLTRLAQVVSSPELDLDNVVEVIELDPVLTGSVLRLANSASSRGVRAVTDVREAIVRLGLGPVMVVAMGGALTGRNSSHHPERDRDRWLHAAASLFAAEAVRSATSGLPSSFLTAALLHDVGQLVEDEDPATAELIGDHGRIGAVVTQSWELPAEVSSAILTHHELDPGTPVAAGVKLADIVAHQVAGEDEPPGTSALVAAVGAPNSAYVSIVEKATARVQWLEERFA